MRNLGVWGLTAILAVALATPQSPADEASADTPQPRSWWERLIGRSPQLPAPEANTEPDEAILRQAAQAKARVARREAEARNARAEFLRRQQIVDRLVEIAVRAENPALEKKARELGERAWAVYLKKTSQRAESRKAEEEDVPAGPRPTGSRREEP